MSDSDGSDTVSDDEKCLDRKKEKLKEHIISIANDDPKGRKMLMELDRLNELTNKKKEQARKRTKSVKKRRCESDSTESEDGEEQKTKKREKRAKKKKKEKTSSIDTSDGEERRTPRKKEKKAKKKRKKKISSTESSEGETEMKPKKKDKIARITKNEKSVLTNTSNVDTDEKDEEEEKQSKGSWEDHKRGDQESGEEKSMTISEEELVAGNDKKTRSKKESKNFSDDVKPENSDCDKESLCKEDNEKREPTATTDVKTYKIPNTYKIPKKRIEFEKKEKDDMREKDNLEIQVNINHEDKQFFEKRNERPSIWLDGADLKRDFYVLKNKVKNYEFKNESREEIRSLAKRENAEIVEPCRFFNLSRCSRDTGHEIENGRKRALHCCSSCFWCAEEQVFHRALDCPIIKIKFKR